MGKYWSDCTGEGRFLIQDQSQHTSKFSFTVNLFVRYPLTNFFAQKYRQKDRQTDGQTDTHTYARQAKNQFSWSFGVSRVRKFA